MNASQVAMIIGLAGWEDDYRSRMNPQLLTELLHAAVPVLKHVGWFVREVRDGAAASCLPLNEESTNQHGTHQAALLMLAADYTGGARTKCLKACDHSTRDVRRSMFSRVFACI